MRDELEVKLTELSFFKLNVRYRSLGIRLDQFTEWKAIREVQFTRNAIVHNLGRYTREYFAKVEVPRYPTEKDMPWGFTAAVSKDVLQEALIDREEIPLEFDYISRSLTTCAAFAREVDIREAS